MTDEELIAKAREHGSLITNEPYFNRPLLESKPQTREFAVVYFEGNNDSQIEIYLDKRTGAFIGATTSPRSDINGHQNDSPSKTITIIDMIDVFSTPTTTQLWIVPGPPQEELGEHISDYLPKRGVHVGTYLMEYDVNAIIEDIKRKFENQGYMVAVEGTAND